VHSALVPWLVGLLTGATIVVSGGLGAENYVLASVSAAIFGDLARRARLERSTGRGDPTDLGIALGFLAILAAGAFDRGGADASSWDATAWWARGVALGVILAGVRLRAVSVRALGAEYAVRLQTRPDQALVRCGPYRFIRHPNYAALGIIACGIALGLQSPLALAATFAVWLPIVMVRIAREERMLVERFGEAYLAYRRLTWRMVPGVY
jgi:protein-S-isoprenylcysteine O-methyltransferase Ste14